MSKKNNPSTKKNKRKWVLIFSAIILIALLAASIWLFLYLKQNIRVKEIIFTGNQHSKNEELYALLKVKKGDPIYGLSLKQMHNNLKQSPWIKDAIIRKEVNGLILIKIVESFPSAILFRAGKPHLVDNAGIILEEIHEPPVIFLPVIMEIDPEKNKDAYKDAIVFINLLNQKKLLSYTGQLEITGNTPDELAIKVDDLLIKIGSGDYEKKLERLDKIKEEIKNKNIIIEYIDLRFSDQVIVKPLTR